MIRVHRQKYLDYSREVRCTGCKVSLIVDSITDITIHTDTPKWELCDDCVKDLTTKLIKQCPQALTSN